MSNPLKDYNGTQRWLDVNGKLHREDGPAVMYSDGYKAWLIHGESHRIDGPAVIRKDGSTEYWIHGIKYTKEQFKFWSKCHPDEL